MDGKRLQERNYKINKIYRSEKEIETIIKRIAYRISCQKRMNKQEDSPISNWLEAEKECIEKGYI